MAIDEKSLYASIAGELKTHRSKKKLTQTELAERVDVARTTIANIEAGHQRPPLNLLYSICSVLEIEPVRIMPTLAAVSSTPQVNVEIGGKTVAMTPKTHEFLATLDHL